MQVMGKADKQQSVCARRPSNVTNSLSDILCQSMGTWESVMLLIQLRTYRLDSMLIARRQGLQTTTRPLRGLPLSQC